MTDHYATLGVPPSAPHAAIRAAYRRTMRATHPDVVGDDPSAVARAIAANQAWTVLRDPARRVQYDRERMAPRADGLQTDGARTDGSRVPSWGPGGARPVTIQQLREAAARERAYSASSRAQRDAFSAASWRLGLVVVLVGAVLLGLVVAG